MSLVWIMKCHFMFVFCYSPIVWCIYLKNDNKIPTFLDSSYFFIMWCAFISGGKTERKQKHDFASWSTLVLNLFWPLRLNCSKRTFIWNVCVCPSTSATSSDSCSSQLVMKCNSLLGQICSVHLRCNQCWEFISEYCLGVKAKKVGNQSYFFN